MLRNSLSTTGYRSSGLPYEHRRPLTKVRNVEPEIAVARVSEDQATLFDKCMIQRQLLERKAPPRFPGRQMQ